MAVKYDFVIDQGARFYRLFYWLDEDGNGVNLTSYSATLSAKLNKASSSTLFSWTSGSEITLGSDGSIEVDVSGSDTGSLDFDYGVYDLLLTDGSGNKIRLIEGTVSLSKKVS